MIPPTPEPIPGAPPYVVWLVGLIFIMLTALILVSIIAIGVWMYGEARERGQPAWLFLILGLLGGWITALIWLAIRDNDWGPAAWARVSSRAHPADPHKTDRV
jgi:4-amino-4-deoxy-L-arabinose transferase-like glycosyltransferase